jgi:hypothetical protein
MRDRWEPHSHFIADVLRFCLRSWMGLIAAAVAEGDPVISEVISGCHRENNTRWKQFHEEFLRARGLRIRAGVTLDDCVTLLAAVADGLVLRALADPTAPVACRRGDAASAGAAGRTDRLLARRGRTSQRNR